MPKKTKQDWIDIAEGFKKKAHFPNCLGAIDGKHVRMKQPKNSGSSHFNYKHFFSVVLMAVVDSDYRFISVDVGSAGSQSDSTILKTSNFWKKFSKGLLDLPDDKELCEGGGKFCPLFLWAMRHFR